MVFVTISPKYQAICDQIVADEQNEHTTPEMTITGGKGNDTIYNDSFNSRTYTYVEDDGNDVIYDYNINDTLCVTVNAGSTVETMLSGANGQDLVVKVGNGSITLTNTDKDLRHFASSRMNLVPKRVIYLETVAADPTGSAVINSRGGNYSESRVVTPDGIAINGSEMVVSNNFGYNQINLIDSYAINATKINASKFTKGISITNNHSGKVLQSGKGDDTLTSFASEAEISSGEGNDYIVNAGDSVIINAGDGNDYIYNFESDTTIYASAGNDTITNLGNSVFIDAGSGADYIENAGSNVTINAGIGNDCIEYKYKNSRQR